MANNTYKPNVKADIKKIKAVYVQFGGRVTNIDGVAKHLVAVAMYSDKELTQIIGIEVCEMTNFEENKQDKFDVYRNRLGEYAAALKFISKRQNGLIARDYDCAVLCPSNSKMWTWLSGGRIPPQIRDLFENINKQFRVDGEQAIDICVSLSEGLADKKAYKYCKPEYIGAQLCRLKRGVHIMTAEEVKKANEIAEERKAKQEKEILDMQGVSVYDILQVNQGNEFEPTIIFDEED